ncbi:MAG: DoxX family membrane protein [Candidatus Palauibacterales bacterium]|jgi:thiosulfate dehydrogenase (quinone) large subunit|nr:DoxX family membrane protein [Candidatus Palauibacterales bacterium]MDP2482721.1 DoxX family membrane protein [Candidatus Palauibacterales bacterium]
MKSEYSGAQLTALVALRFAIGWHFFYEGVSKAVNAYWTSAGFLEQSQGFLSEWFVDLASNPSTLAVVDFLNVWGLVLVGLGLMLGGLTRTAACFGILMLILYYLATPPWPGFVYAIPAEGAYLIINKTFIELCALLVTLFFPTGKIIGLDRLVRLARARGSVQESYA